MREAATWGQGGAFDLPEYKVIVCDYLVIPIGLIKTSHVFAWSH